MFSWHTALPSILFEGVQEAFTASTCFFPVIYFFQLLLRCLWLFSSFVPFLFFVFFSFVFLFHFYFLFFSFPSLPLQGCEGVCSNYRSSSSSRMLRLLSSVCRQWKPFGLSSSFCCCTVVVSSVLLFFFPLFQFLLRCFRRAAFTFLFSGSLRR
jgi:hypothetical protein